MTCLEKGCPFGLPRMPFVNCCQFMHLVLFPSYFDGSIWDLIVSVPDHCLSFDLLFKGDDILLLLLWLCWCFTALRHILGHFGRGQLT